MRFGCGWRFSGRANRTRGRWGWAGWSFCAAVETSKVFIREVTAIDPLWLTELAYVPGKTAPKRLILLTPAMLALALALALTLALALALALPTLALALALAVVLADRTTTSQPPGTVSAPPPLCRPLFRKASQPYCTECKLNDDDGLDPQSRSL